MLLNTTTSTTPATAPTTTTTTPYTTVTDKRLPKSYRWHELNVSQYS